MDYHGRIMNIPRRDDYAADRYSCGHKDARHAAAEIVLEAQAEIERLRSAIHGITPWLSASLEQVHCAEYRAACEAVFAVDTLSGCQDD